MFYNSYKIMFFLILMSGTLITVSSNSWFGAWMGLEINLLSFIPLMSDNNNNLMATEASLKYFLTQALASSILLFSVILLIMETNLITQIKNFNNLMILSSLLLKCGAAPFHFWFPTVMEGLNWSNGLILMTWQKIAPLMLISYTPMMTFILWSTFFSLLIGSLGGLNQTSLRKLMAFSSINHLGWMLITIFYSETLWMAYFMFYSFLSMSLVLMWNFFNLFHINHLFSFSFNSKILKMFMFLSLLSLGGLPPFMGFLPKWMVIQLLVMNHQLFLLTIMVTLTLITLYFYLRLCYAAFMLNYFEPNWFNSSQFNTFSLKIYFLLSFISVFGLMMISLIYSFL